MLLAAYIANSQVKDNPKWTALCGQLSSCELYYVNDAEDLRPGTDVLLCAGGDGTFLAASQLVAGLDIPLLGVNFGRLGFLSENKPEEVAEPLLKKEFVIENRDLLSVSVNGGEPMYALNEVTVTRKDTSLMGVDVTLNREPLPTYWADGLLIATCTGSTAYSLSVGGPICAPDTEVLVLSPVAPHNLNVRPLIVSSKSRICMSFKSREPELTLTMDNRTSIISAESRIEVSVAQFSLKRLRLGKSNFIGALRSKLFWGEDVRNED